MRGAGKSQLKSLSLGLWLLMGLLPTLAQAASPPEAGKIVLVKGDVFILSAKDKSVVADPSGKRGRSTQKGAAFFEGETIQTKDGARVKLLFVEGGNEVVLGSSTSLVVERAGASKSGTELSLNQGTVRSSVNRKYTGESGDIFEVKTPNSVAGVRGTVFNVAYDSKKNTTQVFTERGSVAVTSVAAGAKGKPILVSAGMFSEVKKSETPSAPAAAPASMIESMSPETKEESSTSSSSNSEAAPANSAGESASNTKSEEAKPAAAAPAAEVKKEEGPAVALAPQPADSTSKPDNRAPASVGPEAPVAPKTMTAGAGSAAASANAAAVAAATKPMDMVNKTSDSLRRTAESALREKNLIEGNLSEINFKVQ
jgi:trimeric autotransporter adhesin